MPTRTATLSSTEAELWDAIGRLVDELVEAGKVIGTEWFAEFEPAVRTPIPHGELTIFDAGRVVKIVDTLAQFEQIKGRWSGRPLKLFDWQLYYEIAPVFGIVRWAEDPLDDEVGGKWLRVIRTAWFEKPRKNGKSTECSGLGLILAFADGEMGAEVYAAARNKDQAKLVFNPAKTMAERCGALRKKLGAQGITKGYLENPSTQSIFRPLASDLGGSLHGLNVHGGVIDEVHIHKTPDTVDAIETGTGSREQPLILFITTADEGITGSIYDTKRTYVENLASGHVVDESFYGVVFAATDEMIATAPFEERTLRAANPGIGYTVTLDYLRGKAREAKSSPSQLNRYLRLHLGRRTKQSIAWFTMAQWDAAMGMEPTLDEWRKAKIAYVGFDLSATTDFTAAIILAHAPGSDEALPMYLGRALFWIPEGRVDDLEKLTGMPLRQWEKEGFVIFTEGNVVDYARFRADLSAEIGRLGVTVSETGYDPWSATETVQEMANEKRSKFGTMVQIRQGYATLSPASKELERLIVGAAPTKEREHAIPTLRFGWNPVLRWMADCVEVMQDPAGNIKPTKPDRRKSAARIDGIAALVTALARSMLRTPPKRRSRGGTG